MPEGRKRRAERAPEHEWVSARVGCCQLLRDDKDGYVEL